MNKELVNFLYNIDLREFLERGRSFEDIMDELEAIYGDNYYAKYKKWMFENCDQTDFAEYVRAVYGVKHYERTLLFVR